MSEYAKKDIYWILYNQILKLQGSRGLKLSKSHTIASEPADKWLDYEQFSKIFNRYKYICVEMKDDTVKRRIDRRVKTFDKNLKWKTLIVLAKKHVIAKKNKVGSLFKTIMSKCSDHMDIIIIVPNDITVGMVKNIHEFESWEDRIVSISHIKYASFRVNPEDHISLNKKIEIVEDQEKVLGEMYVKRSNLKRESVRSPLAIWRGCVEGDVICVRYITPTSLYQREYIQIV